MATCIAQSSSIPAATAAFEAIRKPRTAYIAKAGRLNLEFSYLVDGPAQEARDAALEKMRDYEAKRQAPPPEPEAGHTPQSLQDFAPPDEVANTFTPVSRAYVSGYDIFAHVSDPGCESYDAR